MEIAQAFNDFNLMPRKDQVKRVAYVHYFQTNSPTFKPKDLADIFKDSNLFAPNISRELSTIIKEKPCHIFKTKNGYALERGFIKVMDDEFRGNYSKEVASKFQDIANVVQKEVQKQYLKEALLCFNTKLYRPAIIMTWIVVIDVLFDHVIGKHLKAFNDELAKANKKITIRQKSDFEELRESDFILYLRASSVITKEQKKILDEKLNVRNSAAHPNSTSFKEAKTATFIEELFNDVVNAFV